MIPLGNNIIIKPIKEKQTSTIILKDKDSNIAEVVKVNKDSSLKVGDKIIYDKVKAKPIENNLIITEDYIFAKIENYD